MLDDSVVKILPGLGKRSPDAILESAKGELTEVLILGWDKNDELFISSSAADVASMHWLVTNARMAIEDEIRASQM
jgi:hypothetical protein